MAATNPHNIRTVIEVVDGVFGSFTKPTFPAQQDILPHTKDLDRIRRVIDDHTRQGITHRICTGRAYQSIEPVVVYTGLSAPGVYEHGTWVQVPGGEGYRLVDVSPDHRSLAAASDALESWARNFDDRILFTKFPDAKLRRRQENTHILTYEVVEGAVAEDVLNGLKEEMPSDVLNALEKGTLQIKRAQTLIDGNPMMKAFDVMPAIDKDNTLRYLLSSEGIDKNQVLGVGYAEHSGIPLLKECGHVSGPANAQEPLKAYVRQQGGFVASQPFADGWVEIMEHFFGPSA